MVVNRNPFDGFDIAFDKVNRCKGWPGISKVGLLNSYEGEMMALMLAIRCAAKAGWKKVILAGDLMEMPTCDC